MKKRYSQEEKARHWRDWKASGLSQQLYCEQQGLKRSSFKNWGRHTTEYPLVPVRIQSPVLTQGYKLQWRDCTIELPRDTAREEWQHVLAALLEVQPC